MIDYSKDPTVHIDVVSNLHPMVVIPNAGSVAIMRSCTGKLLSHQDDIKRDGKEKLQDQAPNVCCESLLDGWACRKESRM